jgi:hypothetical protein
MQDPRAQALVYREKGLSIAPVSCMVWSVNKQQKMVHPILESLK